MTNPTRVKLWDVPVRLVHWLMVVLMVALWGSAEWHNLVVHKVLGSVLLCLVVFRLIWGVIGSQTARFASFVRGPAAILAYVRGGKNAAPVLGHNPLGALSVLALLGLVLAQLGLGLIANDTDGTDSGPLSDYVSFEWSDWAAHAHGLNFYLLLLFVVLHLGAIIYYRVAKRDNLVAPMVTGWKELETPAPQPKLAPWPRAVVAAVVAAAFAYFIARGAHF
jgi:cytochrome b